MAMCTNVYDTFNAPKWLQDCMLTGKLKWHTNEVVQWPWGKKNNVMSADESSDLVSDYKHLSFTFYHVYVKAWVYFPF